MNLTGKQLVEQGIIFELSPQKNFNPILNENIQQHGVDLNLIKVYRIDGTDENGVILRNPEKKTTLARRWIEVLREDINETQGWYLMPGAYDITFAQGCNIPQDQRMQLVQRSSILRNGGLIASSLFDAGFKTDNIGTVMYIFTPIFIEVGARIAQAYCTASNIVENLYNGQWQGQ